MIEINNIYNCDCLEGMRQLDDNSVDLTVCSPPYDSLRKYIDEDKGECEWNFDIFKPIADELFRVTKKGGVVVWVVGDACVNAGETGSSFRQALYFQSIGFKIHDTMIYEKNSSSFPARLDSQRYTQIFEYMFVFSKGKIRKDIKLIADKRNKWAGWTNWGQHSQYDAEGKLVKTNNIKPIAEFSLRNNIWKYPVSFNDKTGHPAVFPEKLAEDHILSWSNEGDLVLDPFMGSGTTAKMAMLNKRNYIGFERNTGYWEESLKRVGKYDGKVNESVSGVTYTDEVGEVGELQFTCDEDKEFEGKLALWKELTSELEEKFNTQSLGILKNLKVNLSYASKANDKRVQAVLNEKAEEEILVGLSSIPVEYLMPIEDETNLPTEEDLKEYDRIIHETTTKKANYESPELFEHKILTEEDVIRICDSRIANYFIHNKEIRDNCIDPHFYIPESYLSIEAPALTDDCFKKKPIVLGDALITKEEIQRAAEALGIREPVKKHRGRPKGSKNKPPKPKIPDYIPALMPKTEDGGDYISEPRVKTDGGSGVGNVELNHGECIDPDTGLIIL